MVEQHKTVSVDKDQNIIWVTLRKCSLILTSLKPGPTLICPNRARKEGICVINKVLGSLSGRLKPLVTLSLNFMYHAYHILGDMFKRGQGRPMG